MAGPCRLFPTNITAIRVGKRNDRLRPKAIACAQEPLQIDSQAARWIARDALRELQTLVGA